jgi:hypothetical protein
MASPLRARQPNDPPPTQTRAMSPTSRQHRIPLAPAEPATAPGLAIDIAPPRERKRKRLACKQCRQSKVHTSNFQLNLFADHTDCRFDVKLLARANTVRVVGECISIVSMIMTTTESINDCEFNYWLPNQWSLRPESKIQELVDEVQQLRTLVQNQNAGPSSPLNVQPIVQPTSVTGDQAIPYSHAQVDSRHPVLSPSSSAEANSNSTPGTLPISVSGEDQRIPPAQHSRQLDNISLSPAQIDRLFNMYVYVRSLAYDG